MNVEVKEIKIRNLNLETYLELKKESEFNNESINTIIKRIIEQYLENKKLNRISSEFSERLYIQEKILENMGENLLAVNYKLAVLLSIMNTVFEFEEVDSN
ncbi:TPA: hypothetical protein PCV96_002273 [Staphylococcus aureus]|uniref:hypothetical protein n=1 Tax=Staphylococcus aureus TaxID=1280 RepID=UPI000913C232|nr:hypothetical protein [Staphylococcus aureus]QPV65671.1 hypothetical protein I1A60_09355 [Staphylococcus aureus]SGR31461.1 Uncharacterised protein [Staphylococcus aureus]SGT78045.1 Uncharacterised protein [Staphylococcus aureus]SGU09583.1 Uncharacterised protein [Staphylococcus aureus]HBC8029322.1 hypothetical protein [Staphylococcus aureus]